MKRFTWSALMARNPALFALILLVAGTDYQLFFAAQHVCTRYTKQQHARVPAHHFADLPGRRSSSWAVGLIFPWVGSFPLSIPFSPPE